LANYTAKCNLICLQQLYDYLGSFGGLATNSIDPILCVAQGTKSRAALVTIPAVFANRRNAINYAKITVIFVLQDLSDLNDSSELYYPLNTSLHYEAT
jgi:hypothetical protein